MSTSGFLIPAFAAVFLSAAAAQNAPEQLGARDMFYHPVKVASAPAATPQKNPTPNKGKSGTTKTTPVEVASSRDSNPPERPPVSTTPTQTPDGGGRIIQTAVRKTAVPPTEGPALGLRYTLVKKGKDGGEVATDTTFHTGDQIQIKIETNQAAYLYIVTQGSSGTWKVQVPSAETPNGGNRVEAMLPYYFPSGDLAFAFQDPKGAEKVFLVVSRDPVSDIQDQIYGLQGGKPKPAAEPQAAPPTRQPALIEARLNIPENRIQQMRNLYSRDLIIERVNPNTTGDKTDKKEFAMYVVNPSGSPNSRLVADISLVHQ